MIAAITIKEGSGGGDDEGGDGGDEVDNGEDRDYNNDTIHGLLLILHDSKYFIYRDLFNHFNPTD